MFNCMSLLIFQDLTDSTFGMSVGTWFALFHATQFRVNYYSSRTLPNMFAFGLTTIALAYHIRDLGNPWSRGNRRPTTIFLLTFSAIAFRSEIALLLVAISVGSLIKDALATNSFSTVPWALSRSILVRLLPAVLSGIATAFVLSIPLDSMLWSPVVEPSSPATLINFIPSIIRERLPELAKEWLGHMIWPELVSFHYNAIEGHSSDWGVQPWHFYFTSAIPGMIANPLLLFVFVPMGVYYNRRCRLMFLECLVFVSGMSLLGHKEWRFIVYIAPLITTIGAVGASRMVDSLSTTVKTVILQQDINGVKTVERPTTSRGRKLLFQLGVLVTVLGTLLSSLFTLYASSYNYPGGTAFVELRQALETRGFDASTFLNTGSDPNITSISVYADNLVCQTGLTRFVSDGIIANGEIDYKLSVDKSPYTPDELGNIEFLDSRFDFVVAEMGGMVETASRHPDKVELIGSIPALDRVRLVSTTDAEAEADHKTVEPVSKFRTAVLDPLRSVLCSRPDTTTTSSTLDVGTLLARSRRLCHVGVDKVTESIPQFRSGGKTLSSICDLCWVEVKLQDRVGIWKINH